VFHEFCQSAPPGHDAKTYSGHGIASTNDCRGPMFMDVCKFNKALVKVKCSKPTGVNKKQIITMAVVIHLGKPTRMEYTFQGLDPNDWPSYQAFVL
jgi:hypothetical protein